MDYVYVVVEGPNDVAALTKLFILQGAKQIKKLKQLQKIDEDNYWGNLTNQKFPYNGDFTERMPVPAFFLLDETLIAVHYAGGESQLIPTLTLSIANLDDSGARMKAIAIVCDADLKEPIEKIKAYQQLIAEQEDRPEVINSFLHIRSAGEIVLTEPRVGIYVFPDNQNQGTLETVLLACAETSYGDLLHEAGAYVGSFRESYGADWKSDGESKAIVGCISNVLFPGTSNNVSLMKGDWLCTDTLETAGVKELNSFFHTLLTRE
ncbi:hypothetical protein CBW65_01325 [Tumebacillus avium]|uniref:Uncharacterized protein n=1 Tax=Tumebacillus avium TaxID=1903704 RepID=A0A1Y0IK79_9BACL|nr:DUF3226 domain-containing protein [Tumebacillus avium]ARU59843.1 hypothetical protein CBW65_01325 [Tumebacillus avium]